MASVIGLGIESSCDETGVSVIEDGKKILANPVFSQIRIHAEYGGVIPENASRAHLEKFPLLLEEARKALPRNPDYVAVTMQPGLIGSLLVGYYAALALSRHYKAPLIPVHHLEAHLYAVSLENNTGRDISNFSYPFLGLLLSGGNSALYLVEDLGKIRIIGDTIDDACGEALDKAAAMLGLPYPGGPSVEKSANEFLSGLSETERIKLKNPLPRLLKNQSGSEFQFSYSGLKTALLYLLKKEAGKFAPGELCHYFQESAFEIVTRNVINAVSHLGVKTVIAAGGVMANTTLRNKLLAAGAEHSFELIFPPPRLCTDNGAMIGAMGYHYFRRGIRREEKISSASEF